MSNFRAEAEPRLKDLICHDLRITEKQCECDWETKRHISIIKKNYQGFVECCIKSSMEKQVAKTKCSKQSFRLCIKHSRVALEKESCKSSIQELKSSLIKGWIRK